jgi:hypothetical protein
MLGDMHIYHAKGTYMVNTPKYGFRTEEGNQGNTTGALEALQTSR